MTILFLHGWHSVPGGVKPTYLKDHGHEVINPALDDDDFTIAVRTAQAEFDKHQPQVVVGSSRGGAVAMNINSGDAKLVLLCPAWKNWGTAKNVRPDTVILHSRADDVIPFADSEELAKTSRAKLIEVGNDHRLADPEPLSVMLWACENSVSQIHEEGRRMLRRIMNLVSQLKAYLEKKMGFSWNCPDLGPGNWHYDAFIRESGYAVSHWHERTADHHSSVIGNIKDEGHAASERIIQLHSLLGNLINFGLVAVGAVAVLSQSILKSQPTMLVIPFTLLAICIAIAAYALRPPHVELKSGEELEVLNQNISAASKREGGWKLAHEVSERKTVIIRQNVLEWIAGFVRVPISLFILAIISIPVVASFGKADHASETDEPKSLTVVVEDEPLKVQVKELKESIGNLTDSVKENGTVASDERKSVMAAVNESRATIDQRLTTVEKAISVLSESLKQEKGIDPKQQ